MTNPEVWLQTARRQHCVVCGRPQPRGHHIITQQQLRKSHPATYELIRWDTRNLLALCDTHHVGHHSKLHAIPLTTVLARQPRVLRFAQELGLTWYLSREYPTQRSLTWLLHE